MSKKKKKNVDFQKVRIKVGRKLKRQNETVVDLTRKKIKLPREREPLDDEPSKPACRILDDTIESLNLERPILQLQAIQSLNNILDPFVRQLMLFTHTTYSPLTLQSRFVQSLLLIYRSLFHSDKPLDLGLQLGDLLSVLTRVCRGAQDPGICTDLFKLFVRIVKLVSHHPTLPDVLRALDQCAIALLQRVEPSWCWLGCRLISLVLEKHCQLISLLTEVHHSRGVSRFADPTEQLVRCNLLSRCLNQLYTNLRQASIRDRSSDRLNLLEATLAYFKDDQYSTYAARTHGCHPFFLVAPSVPSDRNSKGHAYIPVNGLNLCQFASWSGTTTSMDLSFIEMESPKLLFLNKKRGTNMTPKTKVKSAKHPATSELSRRISQSLEPSSIGDELQWCERAVVVGMLNEGLHLLDDLSRGYQENVLRGLLSVVRCLRVLFEYKSWMCFSTDLSATASSNPKSSVDVHTVVVRFTKRLLSVFPIGFPQDDEEPGAGASLALSGLWNRDMRRAEKRMKKMRNREERRPSSVSADDSQSAETSDQNMVRPTHYSRPVISIHLLNQSVLELCTHLERVYSSCPSLGRELWPPPVESQERFVNLISSFTKYGNVLPSNMFIMWLRSFDLYLLAPARNPRDFSSLDPQSRLFTAPILMCLRGSLDRLQRAVLAQPSRPFMPRQHRLYGRIVGVLTGFFTYALQCYPVLSSANSDHITIDESSVTEVEHSDLISYDESWIRSHSPPVDSEEDSQSSDLLPTLVRLLTHLVHTEPPRIFFAPPLSEHCSVCVATECMQLCNESLRPTTHLIPIQLVETTWASCLNRLISLRCAPAVKASALSPDLKAKLELAKQLEYQVMPLTSLVNKLNIALPTELSKVSTNQFGWVVPGYLPSTTYKYASAVFWRANYRKDRWNTR